MPVVGPMLATLVSMSPAGQMPLACQGDYQGVICQFDDPTSGAESPEPAGSVKSVLESIDAPAPQEAAIEDSAADPEQADESAVLEPGVALDPEAAAAEPEPQANVAVAADEDDDADEARPWVDPEEAVTLRQIAELDRADDETSADADTRDPEATPQPDSASASTEDVASVDEGAPAEDERPVDAEPVQAPDAAGQGANAAPGEAELDTGPGLVSAERRAWIDQFARVRQEVRDAFRTLQP